MHKRKKNLGHPNVRSASIVVVREKLG